VFVSKMAIEPQPSRTNRTRNHIFERTELELIGQKCAELELNPNSAVCVLEAYAMAA